MCLWQMKLCKASSIEERAEGGKTVSEIRIKENESIDSALRRFKRSCAKAGTLSELRKVRQAHLSERKRKGEKTLLMFGLSGSLRGIPSHRAEQILWSAL